MSFQKERPPLGLTVACADFKEETDGNRLGGQESE
jgi:hypothetical protein